jgi:glycine/D-amino acid oxidase-like deaminating enzyme
MKVGIVGAGAVGSAGLLALVMRGSAREIVLVNRNRKRADGVITDVQYGAVLSPAVELRRVPLDGTESERSRQPWQQTSRRTCPHIQRNPSCRWRISLHKSPRTSCLALLVLRCFKLIIHNHNPISSAMGS